LYHLSLTATIPLGVIHLLLPASPLATTV